MKKAQRIQKQKAARATQKIGRQVNKEIAALREQLQHITSDKEALEEELEQVKTQLKSTVKELKRNKISNVKLKAMTNYKKIKLIRKLRLNIRQIATSGPFSSLIPQNKYQSAALSAANRIERMHPGFFNKVGNLPGILDMIWDFYASVHAEQGDNFYETNGEEYVDDDQYEVLTRAIEERYNFGEQIAW